MSATKLLVSIIMLIGLIIYFWSIAVMSTYVKSRIDGKYYLVRDIDNKQDVADTLAIIKQNIIKLTDYMLQNASDEYKPYVERLYSKINNVVISENIRDFYYTSYSVNKGEQLVFCMRSRHDKHEDKQHDINLMMYVALHEISHIACPEYGHTETFKKIFKYVTQCAIDCGLYTKIDFKKEPTEYCGLIINESII